MYYRRNPRSIITFQVPKITATIGIQNKMNVVWKRESNGKSRTTMSIPAARRSMINALTLIMMSCCEEYGSAQWYVDVKVPTWVIDSGVADAPCT